MKPANRGTRAAEPKWEDGCTAEPKDQCRDCQGQRRAFGYEIVDGKWVKVDSPEDPKEN